MQLRYNYRLYLDTAQREALARAFGCARVVFNDGLRLRQEARENGEKYMSDGDLSKQVVTAAKGTPERAWLCEVSSVVLQQAVGLGRTRLAKSVHDAGWASFTGMLEYKAARHGRTFARVDRFFPSTRMCSACGHINNKMALNVRTWECPCGSTHDRDLNAAINVLAAGQAESRNDRGARIRPGLVPVPRREAVTHPGAARSTRNVAGSPSSRAERMSR